MAVCPPVDKAVYLYSQQHLWFSPIANKRLLFGISEFYQDQLSTVLFVDFVAAHREMLRTQSVVCVIESAKSLTEIALPFAAMLIQTNPQLAFEPGLLNDEPEAAGWLAIIETDSAAWQHSLLSATQYQRYLDQ